MLVSLYNKIDIVSGIHIDFGQKMNISQGVKKVPEEKIFTKGGKKGGIFEMGVGDVKN
jgi:hypothetical protein